MTLLLGIRFFFMARHTKDKTFELALYLFVNGFKTRELEVNFVYLEFAYIFIFRENDI